MAERVSSTHHSVGMETVPAQKTAQAVGEATEDSSRLESQCGSSKTETTRTEGLW